MDQTIANLQARYRELDTKTRPQVEEMDSIERQLAALINYRSAMADVHERLGKYVQCIKDGTVDTICNDGFTHGEECWKSHKYDVIMYYSSNEWFDENYKGSDFDTTSPHRRWFCYDSALTIAQSTDLSPDVRMNKLQRLVAFFAGDEIPSALASCDCVFCAKFEFIPIRVSVMCFVPLNPVVHDGHMLFTHRVHTSNFTEDPAVTADLARYAAQWVADNRPGEDCNMITSKGRSATQTVMHTHIHVVFRTANDGLQLPWSGQH
jgi:histidine triad (HIT) family protein